MTNYLLKHALESHDRSSSPKRLTRVKKQPHTMREVSVSWDRDALVNTDLALLDEVVERLSFIGNLLITPDGVRQIILPVYKEGKALEDLEALPYITVEQVVNEREGGALVIWNTHALVCLASTTENIYIMLPTEYENGTLILTFRGIPQAIASFVKLSKVFLPPADIRVRDILEEGDTLADVLTHRQHECYALAIQHGYYNEPKAITIQALADILGIARSTYQEHLQTAETVVLKWAGEQI